MENLWMGVWKAAVTCPAVELDRAAAVTDSADGEALAGKPICDRLDVSIGGAELGAKLGGREPLMEHRGRFVLLLCHEAVERGFLRIAVAEREDHALHGRASVDRAEIRGQLCVGMRISYQRGALCVVHLGGDADFRLANPADPGLSVRANSGDDA
jgi:hypothetical protein